MLLVKVKVTYSLIYLQLPSVLANINLALNKPASQNSIHSMGEPSYAVDGDRNSHYHAWSCSHTDSGPGNWWMVDLEQEAIIYEVIVANRNNLAERLADFNILIGTTLDTLELCAYFAGPGVISGIHTIPCSQAMTGRYVKLQKITDVEPLTLCEVEVMGTWNSPAAVDGGWTSWSLWSSCTLTCGTGSKSRSRSCTDPAPSNGGADCSGGTAESSTCNTQACPVDGGWASWTAWSSCTFTCGTGIYTRSRSCTDPEPSHGGADCSGDTTESSTCNSHHCPVSTYQFMDGKQGVHTKSRLVQARTRLQCSTFCAQDLNCVAFNAISTPSDVTCLLLPLGFTQTGISDTSTRLYTRV